MKTGLLLQFGLLSLLLLATSSKGFFFEYPKKAFSDFIQSLKEKKEAKKKPHVPNIRHYHVHYYPAHVHVIKAPEKYELDKFHGDQLTSLGWTDYEYKYTPEPRVTVSSSFWHDIPNPFSWARSFLEQTSETGVSETIDRTESEGVLVKLPIQTIAVQNSSPSPKSKTSLLEAFFEKMSGSKNSV